MNYRVPLLFVLVFSGACGRCDSEKPVPAAPSTSVSAAPAPSGSSASVQAGGDDDVVPVYPKTSGPPEPLAEKLCAALHDLPTNRRAACCNVPAGYSLASECVRTLSHALRDKSVSLDAAAVETCATAMNTAHAGCDWVAPANVALPAACDGILHGTIDEGKRCRSSLECLDGLRCVGVGPTDAGVCRKPLPARYPCTLAVDTLAALTLQNNADVQHPECAGYCRQRRCHDFVPLHGACKIDAECGSGQVCLGGTCEQGRLPGEGKPCAKGTCDSGLRCEKGTCAARKPKGATCTNDTECVIGGCSRGAGAKEGTCGMKCGMR